MYDPLSPNRDLETLRKDARNIFSAGIDAVKADQSIYRNCRIENSELIIGDLCFDLTRFENLHVIGTGKATAQMAMAMENLLGDHLTSGLITVKYGHTASLEKIRTIEAGHPVPDENGRRGAAAILDLANSAGASDLIICLLSGGGSALLPLPAEPVSLIEKQETIRCLLNCGASIGEINAIRKHISAIKGGQLARRAYPAPIVSLILSDVIGDRLDVIASGPTVTDPSRYIDCLEIIDKYRLSGALPRNVMRRLEQGASGRLPETPKTGDPLLSKSCNRIIGNNESALAAAREKAQSLGYATLILSSMIGGDTHEAARLHVSVAKEIRRTGNPLSPPACILSGGETTVQVTGKGLGGRNQEFGLVSALELDDLEGVVVLSGGTDGTDGPTDAAGVVVGTDTIRKGRSKGMDPIIFLKNNDTYHFFAETGELLMTGPTGTNVMDLRIMLIG